MVFTFIPSAASRFTAASSLTKTASPLRRARRARRGPVRHAVVPTASANKPPEERSEQWNAAVEALFVELLRTYYEGMPMLSRNNFV